MYQQDVFDAHRLIGPNYILGDYLKIKFKSDAKVVRAEKVVHLYPTVWSGRERNLMQYIYLFDLEYCIVQPLDVKRGVIFYPAGGPFRNEASDRYFRDLSKSQILSSVQKVPEEYKEDLSYQSKDWNEEQKQWLAIADSYQPGELTNNKYEPFEVNPYEIDLVVTFRSEDGVDFKKIFRDRAIVGN